MKMFEQYLSEHNSRKLFQNEYGFFTYQLMGEKFFVPEIFIQTEFRGTKVGDNLLDEINKIALYNDCKKIQGVVDITTNNPERSAISMIKRGFKFYHIEGTTIYFEKDVSHG